MLKIFQSLIVSYVFLATTLTVNVANTAVAVEASSRRFATTMKQIQKELILQTKGQDIQRDKIRNNLSNCIKGYRI